MQEREHALAGRNAERVAAAGRAEDRRRAPVRREPVLRRGKQHEHDCRRRRAHILLVLNEVAREHGRREDERRRAVELHALRRRALLQPCERLRADDAEAPGLRQVMVRREARGVEHLEERFAGDGFRAEDLVGPALACELGEVHARRALTCTSAPARFSNCENGQLSSAFSTTA